MSTQINITEDEFGTFSYTFQVNGQAHECFDFPSEKEALSGAQFHLDCLSNDWTHEVADGIGAIFRSK